MVKEEWEDEEVEQEEGDYQEENECGEEYEEEEYENEDIIEMLKADITRMIKERSKYPTTSKEHSVLTARIGADMQTLKDAEAAESERASAENERASAETARRNKNAIIWNILGNGACNALTQGMIAYINRKNVKTVVGCENEGGIVNSKGMKFCK